MRSRSPSSKRQEQDAHVTAEEIIGLVKGLRTDGQSVVIVTHDPKMAGYADRIVFLKDGRVVDEERIRATGGPATCA